MCHSIPHNQYECKNDMNIFIVNSFGQLMYISLCLCECTYYACWTHNSECTKQLLTLHEVREFPKKRENSEKEESMCVS